MSWRRRRALTSSTLTVRRFACLLDPFCQLSAHWITTETRDGGEKKGIGRGDALCEALEILAEREGLVEDELGEGARKVLRGGKTEGYFCFVAGGG